MIYALNLSQENRVLSVTYDRYAPRSQPRVDTLPEGNIADYLYINNEFVYNPLPVPPEPVPEPTAEEILNALLGVEENEE